MSVYIKEKPPVIKQQKFNTEPVVVSFVLHRFIFHFIFMSLSTQSISEVLLTCWTFFSWDSDVRWPVEQSEPGVDLLLQLENEVKPEGTDELKKKKKKRVRNKNQERREETGQNHQKYKTGSDVTLCLQHHRGLCQSEEDFIPERKHLNSHHILEDLVFAVAIAFIFNKVDTIFWILVYFNGLFNF